MKLGMAAEHRPPQPCFFVHAPRPDLPGRAALERLIRRWIMRELSGWLQLRVLELVDGGQVEWAFDVELPGALGFEVCPGPRVLAVRCVDEWGPRRPGLWAALAVAHALAELLGGSVIDAFHSAALFGPRRWMRPLADGRVHIIDHLRVPSSSAGGRCRWLSSLGLAQFGLPDVELVELPPAAVERGARLLLGVAQHLVDSGLRAPSAGSLPREVMLTVGELHWALGGELGSRPLSTGRGWTRVALTREQPGAWPQLLRLGPPAGARRWGDRGAWLRDAWRDLYGSAGGAAPVLRALR